MATLGSDATLPNATGPCIFSVQILAEKATKDFERMVLSDFLAKDTTTLDTIDNLKQLLERMATITNCMSKEALFNARRALISLETLATLMKQ